MVDPYLKSLNLDAFIATLNGHDFESVYEAIFAELDKLDRLRVRYGTHWKFNDYRDHINGIVYYLEHGLTLPGVTKNHLRRFLPVLQHLVGNGELSEVLLYRLE